MFGAGERGRGGVGAGSPMVVSISAKRKGDDEGPGGGILASPASIRGGDPGKKDGKKDSGG